MVDLPRFASKDSGVHNPDSRQNPHDNMGFGSHDPASGNVAGPNYEAPYCEDPDYEATVGLPQKQTYAGTAWSPVLPAIDRRFARPVNFGTVLPGLYRSGYPQPENFEFLKQCGIKTIVTLVDKEMPNGYQAWMRANNINHFVFDMAGTKKEAIPEKTMDSIIQRVMNKAHYPLLIHCNHGKHRTGCVVGVVRHIHSWNVNSIVDEYTKYAEPKVRDTDINYITNFQVTNIISSVAPRVIAARAPHPDAMERAQKVALIALVAVLVLYILWVPNCREGIQDLVFNLASPAKRRTEKAYDCTKFAEGLARLHRNGQDAEW